MIIHSSPKHYGDESDGGYYFDPVFQGKTKLCAIYAQYHILKDYGFSGSIEDLTNTAIKNGWYDPEIGVMTDDMGKLLEANGVSCMLYTDAHEYNLIAELAKGKHIIVKIDPREICDGFNELDKSHAVVVKGINFSNPEDVKIVLLDSGVGCFAKEYSFSNFMKAWKNRDCLMWVPTDSPTHRSEDSQNFTFTIADVAELPNHGFVVTGGISCGEIRVGHNVEVIGFGKKIKTYVKGIEKNGRLIDYAKQGESVGLLLPYEAGEDIVRGQMVIGLPMNKKMS